MRFWVVIDSQDGEQGVGGAKMQELVHNTGIISHKYAYLM